MVNEDEKKGDKKQAPPQPQAEQNQLKKDNNNRNKVPKPAEHVRNEKLDKPDNQVQNAKKLEPKKGHKKDQKDPDKKKKKKKKNKKKKQKDKMKDKQKDVQVKQAEEDDDENVEEEEEAKKELAKKKVDPKDNKEPKGPEKNGNAQPHKKNADLEKSDQSNGGIELDDHDDEEDDSDDEENDVAVAKVSLDETIDHKPDKFERAGQTQEKEGQSMPPDEKKPLTYKKVSSRTLNSKDVGSNSVETVVANDSTTVTNSAKDNGQSGKQEITEPSIKDSVREGDSQSEE